MTPAQYRKTRESLGLSQPELADILKLHWLTISKRERGIYGPHVKTEWELALRWIELNMKYDLEKE